MSKRFIAFDHQGEPLYDLDLSMMDGEGAVRRECLNGEHSLEITTIQRLGKGMRILSQDGTGKWREWVVDEPCDAHDSYSMLGTYGCTWSMQYDLATVDGGELWPGTYDPIAAATALAMVLGVQNSWEVGYVTVNTLAGTSLYDGQVWDYLGKLQEVWGGEMEPRIVVDSSGVTHRYVDWLAHVGSEVSTRRFDYGKDCTGITRKEDPGPHYCRIVPRGGHDATDADGVSYSERVGIEEEPYASGDGWVHDAGSKWIRDPDAELDFRVPDGNGGWRYPEKVVIYDSDDPEEVLALAAAEVHDHTRPKSTYEIDVTQYAEAGRDPHGVQLGDEIHVVDKEFGAAPLRLQERVVEMTVNELDEGDVQLVLGDSTKGIESAFRSMASAIETVGDKVRSIEGDGTIVHVQELLDAINAEINATGGYTYLVPGIGAITYDTAVSDPTEGDEASQAVEMRGGTLRFANSRTSAGDWRWTNVITADGYLALAATIARLTSGYIGSAESGNYWNLDTGELRMAATADLGGRTVQQALADIDSAGISKIEYGTSASSSTAPTSWSTTVPASVAKGSWLWIRTTYKNGGTSTTKAYAGTDGMDGQDGRDGTSVSIASREVKYAKSGSGTTTPSSGWQESPPSTSAGEYLWSRTTVTYSDGTDTVTYGVAAHGQDGTNGDSFAWNLLNNTEQPTTSDLVLTRATVANGVVTLTPTTSASTAKFNVDYLDYSEYGAGHYTVSFDARSTGDTSTYSTEPSIRAYIGYSADGREDKTFSSTYDYYGYRTVDTLTSQWERYSITFAVPGDLGTGTADALVAGSNLSVLLAETSKRMPAQVRNVKLERGDKATPWATSAADLVGADGTSVTVSSIEYGTSQSSSATPESWSQTAPTSLSQGTWLWVRTTYSDGGTATTKSYVGTDGEDGTSVAITSASKSGDTTTVVITDGSTTSTLTIVDGQDGASGANGLNGYVHTAWANSADGQTDFSTSASTGKQYLGVYTDNTAADSTSPGDYSWSLIKGADGTDGDDGVGITSVVEQYYLSTSDQTQTGGSWSDAQPTWTSGTYIWTRSAITWDTTPASTTYTTPTLANALNQLNSDVASNAQAIVTETQNRTSAQAALAAELGVFHDDLAADIAEARRYATDYLAFNNGELTIGVANNAVKNVLRADSQVYRTNAGDIAGYGLFGGIWEMFIETARIQNMLRFGDFAWIARQNGNMTLKWTGA